MPPLQIDLLTPLHLDGKIATMANCQWSSVPKAFTVEFLDNAEKQICPPIPVICTDAQYADVYDATTESKFDYDNLQILVDQIFVQDAVPVKVSADAKKGKS